MYEHLGHTNESFKNLNKDWQSVLENLKNVIAINFESRQLIWNTFNKFKIKVNNDIFLYMKDGDSIEMWSDDYNLMMVIGKVSRNSTYTIEDLRSDHWENLFHRPEKAKQDIYNAIIESSTTGKSALYCGDWHEVTETKTKYKYKQQVRVKLITPYKFDELSGMLAIVESKPPLRVYDRVRQVCLTWLSKKKAPLKSYLKQLGVKPHQD